jgi:hypothetical protein
MKNQDVKIGNVYEAKVSDKLARVRITRENPHGGWYGLNLATNRTVRIKSAQKLRRRLDAGTKKDAAGANTGGDAAAGKATAKPKKVEAPAGGDRDWTCPACRRTLRLPQGEGRCECGQALLVRGGKRLTKVDETPHGCAKTIPPAEVVAEPPAEEPTPRKKRERADGTMSGLDAAAKVLADAGEPLGSQEICKRMLDQGLWATSGKTPAATIYSAVLRDIQKRGDESRFRKADRGTFEIAK